jgi:hypothetical protein
VEIGKFNKYLHLAKHEIYVMKDHEEQFGKDDFYHHEMEILHTELIEAGHDLEMALLVVFIQLMTPINLLIRYFFFKKTNRKASGFTINDLLEFFMFIVTVVTLYEWLHN